MAGKAQPLTAAQTFEIRWRSRGEISAWTSAPRYELRDGCGAQ